MKTIEERAELNLQYEKDFLGRDLSDDMLCRAYIAGAKEQKAIDEKYINLLEEDRNAFIAFCYNKNIYDTLIEGIEYLINEGYFNKEYLV